MGSLWGDETNMQGHRLLNGHAATGGPGPLGPLTPPDSRAKSTSFYFTKRSEKPLSPRR